MGYVLQTKKTDISKKWVDQKFIMLGNSGIGKSTFWSFADNVGYIEAEAGLNFISAMKNPARNWRELSEIIMALMTSAKEGNFPYNTLVVDTIDRIVDYAGEATLEWARGKYKGADDFKGIGDIPNGAGWDMRKGLVDKFLRAIEYLPCAKVLIGHLETKKIEELGQKGYDKSTISIGGKIGADILHWSDHTLNVVGIQSGDTLKRIVYTKPTQSKEAKSRGNIIKDGWIWAENDEDNFKKLRSCFE